jgi:small redox-active disulfide protein 2
MKIQIAGPGCPKCQMAEKNVRAACEQMNLDSEVTHISDFKEYAKYGVMLTPSVIVDGKVIFSGKVPSLEELKKTLDGLKQ